MKLSQKFNVGDWVIRSAEGFKHNTYLVTEVKGYYVCEDLKGGRVTFTFNDVNKNFKLWDISDAKDGDVLATDSGRPFIFKGLLDMYHPESLVAYCGIAPDNYFDDDSSIDNEWWTHENVHPAIEEQRELLFSKMKEAGYEWDVEKKELRKIDARKNLTLDGDLMQADCMVVEQSSLLENRNVSPLLYGVIDSKKRENLLERLEELYNILGINIELNTPDYLLAEFTLNCLVSYGNAITKNIEKGYIKPCLHKSNKIK